MLVSLLALLVALVAKPDRADAKAIAFTHIGQLVAKADPPKPPPASSPPSEVEKIANLERTIKADEKQIEDIDGNLNDPKSEYAISEKEFKELDAGKVALQKTVESLRAEKKLDEAAVKEKKLAELEKSWLTAKARFELALDDRKTLQMKAANLKQKIAQDKQELMKLTNHDMKEAMPDAKDNPKEPKAEPKTSEPAKTPSLPGPIGQVPPESAGPATNDKKGESKALVGAREEAQRKEAAARDAKAKAQTLAERVESLRTDIAADMKLLESARKKRDLEDADRRDLDEALKRAEAANPQDEGIPELCAKAQAAEERFAAADDEVQRLEKQLAERNLQLAALLAEQNAADEVARHREFDAAEADKKVQELVNPYTPRNVLQWLIDHGPRLLAIVIIMWLLQRLVRIGSRRFVNAVVARTGRKSQRKLLEDRVDTLNGVFRNTASLLILSGGTLMFLQELGIPIVPLMGGAAVFGLAFAFGAQNLIKDYFSGFMILLEDQYAVRDVVKIGDVAGLVERISLRVTMLRDLDGNAHFIPNGSISSITNMTHGWSRSLFDIGVSYREDVDRVMAALVGLCKELREDPKFGPWILDDPEMLGVDALTDSAIVIKFFVKTQPLKQWDVKRELLRRIKIRFDEMGIEIPFPQRVVHHRYDERELVAINGKQRRA
jgi:small conductance mechanosensitive channel